MTSTNKPKIGFWVIALSALIWNTMGAYMYIIQKYRTEAFESQYSPQQLEIIYNMPAWATAAFALAVFAGVVGSIALACRKKIAFPAYFISLLGIVIHMIYTVFMSATLEADGLTSLLMPIMVLIIGLFLNSYSKNAILKGWLN